MGLMTETPWESAFTPTSSNSNRDYHRENLRQLKKMQQLAKLQKEAEMNHGPMKAFPNAAALTEANKKKFDHVQSRVHEWATTAKSAESSSSVKGYLKSHQKTGPFLENADDESAVVKVRRLSGLRAKQQGIVQPSDYGTMSQSCHSIPPLNLDEDYNELDDLHREMSLGFVGLGVQRFGEVTIEERKYRIRNLVNEIYNTAPLSEGHSTKRSLNQTLKRYASVDQVSDVDSVITMRPNNHTKLTRNPSINHGPLSMRKYASSPKLNSGNSMSRASHISVQNLGPLASTASMVNLKMKKNSLEEHVKKHMPLKKNDSAPPMTSVKKPSPVPTTPTPVARSKTPGESSLKSGRDGDDEDDDDDDETVMNGDAGSVIRGSDIDYVRANIHCATAVGHARRKEYEIAQALAEERKKKKSDSMKPKEGKYKTGSVPKYLQNRQAEWKAEAEKIEREKPDPDCPPGHRKLSDGDRREALGRMKEKYNSLVNQANNFPVRNDTMRVRQMKADLEQEMTTLENAIRVYERPKVFVKIDQEPTS